MKDAALQLYENQALLFLQSLTIKFSPISDAYNDNIMYNLGQAVDKTDPTTFKYYLNLTGQYHSTDTVMTIQSIDTKQMMNFTVENLTLNPKTKAAYVLGSSYYTNLCNRYPNQVDLIKSIVYPVQNIYDAIQADDFTILSYGNGFLEDAESDAVIYDLKTYIDYATSRWYQSYLRYEDYFYWTFWGFLWQNLFLAIMASRLKYTKTAYVNSFHVWQYLDSYNIGDYSDVLTTKQATFLYRNIDYLRANKGKQATLRILADNLLETVGVGLVGKTIYHQTQDGADTCKWVPEIVSQTIPTDNAQWIRLIAPESMTDIAYELYNNGLDISVDQDYVAKQTATMTNTTVNVLPTKLLEIQQIGLDTKYSEVLNNFVLDTLIYTINEGIYAPVLDFDDPLTGTHILLSGKESLILYYYCVCKSTGLTPTSLPSIYSSTSAYVKNISLTSLPTTMNYNGVSYKIREFFYPEELVSGIAYPSVPETVNTDFSNLVGSLFGAMIQHIRFSRSTGDYLTLKALRVLYDAITVHTTYSLSLDTTYTTYTPWLGDATHSYTEMIAGYDTSLYPKENYDALATLILQQLIPITNPILLQYIDNTDKISQLYIKLKELFVQLCSYNIAFLDTSREQIRWTFLERLVMSFDKKTGMSKIYQDTSFLNMKTEFFGKTDLEYRMTKMGAQSTAFSGKTEIKHPIDTPTYIKQDGTHPISYDSCLQQGIVATQGSAPLRFQIGPRFMIKTN